MNTLNLDQIRNAIGLNETKTPSVFEKAAGAPDVFDPVATEMLEVLSHDTLGSFLSDLEKQGSHVPPHVFAFVKSAEAAGYTEEDILQLLEAKLR